jgi:hypothetical protein
LPYATKIGLFMDAYKDIPDMSDIYRDGDMAVHVFTT